MAEPRFKEIDRSAVDATLYGIDKGLDFLGEESRLIQDEMGKMMLEYLIDTGAVRYDGKPDDFRQALTDLLTKNGFGKNIPLEFTGSPPVPSVHDFVRYLSESGNHTTGSRVDWILYEMVLYGMTKGLDSIGAQGQILIDRIIWELLNHLVDGGQITRSDDPEKFMQSIGDYFVRVGFISKFEKSFEGPGGDMFAVSYTDSRYHLNVLKRLRSEGSVLYSCPPCIAAGAIMKKKTGVRAQYAVEYRVEGNDRVILHHKMYFRPERFTEEEARRVSQMMEGSTQR